MLSAQRTKNTSASKVAAALFDIQSESQVRAIMNHLQLANTKVRPRQQHHQKWIISSQPLRTDDPFARSTNCQVIMEKKLTNLIL